MGCGYSATRIWDLGDRPWTLAAASESESCGYLSIPDFPVLWQPASVELECAHPLGACPTQTPGTSGGKRVGPGSVRLALSATATNRLLEIKPRLLEAAGARRKAESSSEETFRCTKENGGGTVSRWIFSVTRVESAIT